MWEKIMIPMYRLWLHGLYGLHGPWCPLSQKGCFNSLVPGRSECDPKNVFFNLVLLIGIFRSSYDNALRWMPQDLTDDKSTLVQVMAWCHQATSHYLSQCWLIPCRLMASLGQNELTYSLPPSLVNHSGLSRSIPWLIMPWLLLSWTQYWEFKCSTVETPYNTAPYITGSNIARLGHGSQNSWSKLWIPIVKSAPVRVIFTWKSVPKKSIHGSSDIYLGTQWHDSPWCIIY